MGYVLTLSGIGSEIGVPLATAGNILDTGGTVAEDILTNDWNGLTEEATYDLTGRIIKRAFLKKVPPPFKNIVDQTINQTIDKGRDLKDLLYYKF